VITCGGIINKLIKKCGFTTLKQDNGRDLLSVQDWLYLKLAVYIDTAF
jgi:hypothetical protein